MALKAIRKNGIIWVTHYDPNTSNAFSVDEATQLESLLANADGVKGLIWQSGHERIFCSGGNLRFYRSQSDQKVNLKANRKIRKALDSLSVARFPTVVVLNGDVYGGGVEILSAFDYVLAYPHIFLGFWQRKQALTFGWGGGLRLRRRISRGLMSQLSLTAKNFSAYEALEKNLIDKVVAEGNAEREALLWIEKQGSLSDSPIEAIKKWSPHSERPFFEKLWLKKYSNQD